MVHRLAEERCDACRVDSPRVSEQEKQALAQQLPDWQILFEYERDYLLREYAFPNFAEALAFTNRIGELAERLDHHPDIALSWGRVALLWYTHAIGGLHRNDFRCAAKADQLYLLHRENSV